MKRLFRRLFAPWRCGEDFEDGAAFTAFLQRVRRVWAVLRVVCLLAAAGCLMAGYAFTEQPFYSIAVAALVGMLLLTLGIGEIEKQMGEGG